MLERIVRFSALVCLGLGLTTSTGCSGGGDGSKVTITLTSAKTDGYYTITLKAQKGDKEYYFDNKKDSTTELVSRNPIPAGTYDMEMSFTANSSEGVPGKSNSYTITIADGDEAISLNAQNPDKSPKVNKK